MRFRDIKKQSKHKQKTPVQNTHYAIYVDKIKAFIIDTFMIYIPILYLITYVIMGGKDEFQESQLAPLFAVTLYGLIYAFLISRFGQTPGKKAYNIRVVSDKDDENISFLRAFLRFLAFLFSGTIIIGLLLPLFRKDKKALHDIVCHTVEIVQK